MIANRTEVHTHTIIKRRLKKVSNDIQTELRRYTIIGKYQRLVMAKSGMPLFVSFHPNNLVKFTLEKVHKDKLPSFLKSVDTWFEKLQILKIEEEPVSDS